MSYPLKISLPFQYLVVSKIPKTIQMLRGGLTTMKLKAVIVSLALLMLIFCSVSQSQAAYGTRQDIRPFDQVVDEHPWQESGAPIYDDTDSKFSVSRIFIVIGFARIITIEKNLIQKATLIQDNSNDNSTVTHSGT